MCVCVCVLVVSEVIVEFLLSIHPSVSRIFLAFTKSKQETSLHLSLCVCVSAF